MRNQISIYICTLFLFITHGCDTKSKEKPIDYLVAIGNITCEEATNEANAFTVYEYIHNSLKAGENPVEIRYLNCFLQNEDIGTSSAETLLNFNRKVFSSNVMYGYLNKVYKEIISKDIELGRKRIGGLAWASFHNSSAAVTAYQNTGETRFIEQYIDFFENIMERRDSEIGIIDDYHGQIMNAWGTSKFGDNKWVAMITHFAVFMGPATEIALLIQSDRKLNEFSWFIDLITDYYKPTLLSFDIDLKSIDDSDVMWYWRPWEEKFEATNHLHLLGQSLINMHKLTNDDLYANRINWIIDVFEKSATIDKDGFVAWNYHPYHQVEKAMNDPNAKYYSEKVWKAGLTIPFIYQAYAGGYDINGALVDASTKTIRDHILADNGISSNLHPKESVAIENDKRNNKSRYEEAITLFLSASEKDSSICRIILNTIATRPDLFQDGWMTKKMICGYAHYLKSDSIKK